MHDISRLLLLVAGLVSAYVAFQNKDNMTGTPFLTSVSVLALFLHLYSPQLAVMMM